jgi:hypothetical protein
LVITVESRRSGWEEHVALKGEKINAYTILVEKPQVKKPQGKIDVGWTLIFKWTLEN